MAAFLPGPFDLDGQPLQSLDLVVVALVGDRLKGLRGSSLYRDAGQRLIVVGIVDVADAGKLVADRTRLFDDGARP